MYTATNNGMMISVANIIIPIMMSFLSDSDIFADFMFKTYLNLANCINLKIFMPPAVENPHPPIVMAIIMTINAIGFKFSKFIVWNPVVVLAETMLNILSNQFASIASINTIQKIVKRLKYTTTSFVKLIERNFVLTNA